MRNSYRYFLIFISYLIIIPSIAENFDRRAVMAEAMLNMMDTFGIFGNQSLPHNGNMLWNRQPNANTGLDGMWLGNSGERLHIQGTNFYLQAVDGRRIFGTLQIRGRMLALYQPRYNIAMFYEYAIQNDKLALRDRQRNLLLYKLMR